MMVFRPPVDKSHYKLWSDGLTSDNSVSKIASARSHIGSNADHVEVMMHDQKHLMKLFEIAEHDIEAMGPSVKEGVSLRAIITYQSIKFYRIN